jgi:hypothetical protein
LKNLCKSYEGNKKTKKEKEKNSKKDERPGEQIQPSSASGPRPTRLKSRKGILSPLPPMTGGTHLSASSTPAVSFQKKNSGGFFSPPRETVAIESSLQSSLFPCRFDAIPRL